MECPFVSAKAMAACAGVLDAVDALEACLRAGFEPEDDLPRTSAKVSAGQLLMMPAALEGAVGLKLVSIAPENPERGEPLVQAVYLLLDGTTLTPLATLDGAYLTNLRTSAVSALAARHLAQPDSSRLALFGTGVQAWAHAHALTQALPLQYVDVVGRTPEKAEALAFRVREELGVQAAPATEQAVAEAAVVACCTTAREPLFPGELLRPGTTVVAIGAYEPDARELDDATLRRATVVVESRASALREAGDVIQAIASGAVAEQDLVTLRALVRGEVTVPADAVRVFKGTGMSWQDLAVAGMLHRRMG